jgi:hypothetical protein
MSDIALNSGFQDILSAVRTLTEAVKPRSAMFEEISRARALLRYSSYVARKHTSGTFLEELKTQGELQDFVKEIERLTDILIASARDLEDRARKRPLFYLPYRLFVRPLFARVVDEFDDLQAFAEAEMTESEGPPLSLEEVLAARDE